MAAPRLGVVAVPLRSAWRAPGASVQSRHVGPSARSSSPAGSGGSASGARRRPAARPSPTPATPTAPVRHGSSGVSGTRQGVEPFVADPELEYVPGRDGSTSCCHDVPSPLRCAGIATDCCHGGEPAVFAASTGAGGTPLPRWCTDRLGAVDGGRVDPIRRVPAGACHGARPAS
jgi:hypothetical protein